MIETNVKMRDHLTRLLEVMVITTDTKNNMKNTGDMKKREVSQYFEFLQNVNKTDNIANKIYDYVENLVVGDIISIEEHDSFNEEHPIKIVQKYLREYYSIMYVNWLIEPESISLFDCDVLTEIINFKN